MTNINRDAVAERSLEDWFRLYRDIKMLLELLPRAERIAGVQTLRKAHDVLQRLAPSLRMDKWVPTIGIEAGHRKETLSIADFLAAGSLLSIADWLDRQMPKTGPAATKGIIAQAAFEISEISRETDGKPDWEWVQRKLKEKFGDDAPANSALRTLAQKARHWKLKGLRRRSSTAAFRILPDIDRVRNCSVEETDQNMDSFFVLYKIRAQRDKDRVSSHGRQRKIKTSRNFNSSRKPHRYKAYRAKTRSR